MNEKVYSVPLIPMKGIITFPGQELSFEVGKPQSKQAIDIAQKNDGYIVLICLKNSRVSNVEKNNLYNTGTYCKIISVISNEANIPSYTVIAKAERRAVMTDFIDKELYLAVDADTYTDEPLDEENERSLKQTTLKLIDNLRLTSDCEDKVKKAKLALLSQCGMFCDAITMLFAEKIEKRQELLDTIDILDRFRILDEYLVEKAKYSQIDRAIEQRMKENIDASQKEFYLRARIQAIREELGDDSNAEIKKYREDIDSRDFPEYVKARLEKELRRLEALPMGSHEITPIRELVECILDLPWYERTDDVIDLEKARNILDRDHYGLTKVKDRIIEYLAVASRKKSLSGQIICLVGPPGVGKTSIVSSIAEAVGRNFVRMSLGGIDDESEIRGHRRTYIGAMPGRVISAMRQAKTINPVILFDEIDKLGKSYRGDPSAALLEVLDSAQNSTFRDHFLELPYDLSNVMFITTANSLDTIPGPLRDRMEIIEVPSYLEFEKVKIASEHLIPKILIETGISKDELIINDDSILEIVRGYTVESGVRTLQRTLESVCRKAVNEIVTTGVKSILIDHEHIEKYLGAAKRHYDKANSNARIGVVNGLAWTAYGGETLMIEVLPVPGGSGKIELTGSLGDVMKESAKIALTYVRANALKYGVENNYFDTHNIHIHAPEGAIPKDGPSAGVTMATAIMSAVSGKPVLPLIAMTGELTLTGNVTAVGGLREKLLAAIRADIKTVLVPFECKPSIDELESEILDNIEIIYISRAEEAFEKALM